MVDRFEAYVASKQKNRAERLDARQVPQNIDSSNQSACPL